MVANDRLKVIHTEGVRSDEHVFVVRDMANGPLVFTFYLEAMYDGHDLLGHNLHILSEAKSTAILRCCQLCLLAMRDIDCIDLVACETQGKFPKSDLLAKRLGFRPVDTDNGWTDWLFDVNSDCNEDWEAA